MGPLSHRRAHVSVGSGNVFSDIGIPEPEHALAKARLADLIGETIGHLGHDMDIVVRRSGRPGRQGNLTVALVD